MSDQKDRRFLLEQAKTLVGVLASLSEGTQLAFQAAEELQPEENESGGWYVILANKRENMPDLLLSFDRWSGRTDRSFWFGFSSERAGPIDDLIKKCPLRLKPVLRISPQDVIEELGVFRKESPLTDKEAETTVVEKYPGDREYYFGIYDVRSSGTGVNTDRVLDFFLGITGEYLGLQIIQEPFRDFEGGRTGAWRDTYYRSVAIASDFISSKNGEFICENCGFDAGKRGTCLSVSPRSLIDVHHKYPLSLGERVTTFEDLQLLCPTCHRIAHAQMRSDR